MGRKELRKVEFAPPTSVGRRQLRKVEFVPPTPVGRRQLRRVEFAPRTATHAVRNAVDPPIVNGVDICATTPNGPQAVMSGSNVVPAEMNDATHTSGCDGNGVDDVDGVGDDGDGNGVDDGGGVDDDSGVDNGDGADDGEAVFDRCIDAHGRLRSLYYEARGDYGGYEDYIDSCRSDHGARYIELAMAELRCELREARSASQSSSGSDGDGDGARV